MLVFTPLKVIAIDEATQLSTNEILQYGKDVISWEKEKVGISSTESLFSGEFLQNAGTSSADWFLIGASRMGLNENYSNYYNMIENNIKNSHNFEKMISINKPTEWYRLIITILATGNDPTNVNGINLVELGIYGDNVEITPDSQGLNGLIWCLIALDSLNWKTPDDFTYNRGQLINKILSYQLEDGGFSLSSNLADTDITAMAIQALSPYINDGTNQKISKSVENALNFLSKNQEMNGTFGNCESTSQVICALCSVGIDCTTDERFVKNNNIYDSLLLYRNSDGGFSHTLNAESEAVASSQALLALSSLVRYENNLRRIYDFKVEFSGEEKNTLSNINNELEQIGDNEKNAIECNNLYSSLSVDMKSYCYKYSNLLKLASKFNISLSNNNFTFEMSYNKSGTGSIFDIENNCIMATDNFNKYEILNEINNINSIISENFENFYNINFKQRKIVEDIVSKVKNLPEDEVELIENYDEICKLHRENLLILTLFVILVFMVLLLIFVYLIHRRKKNDRHCK